MSDGGRDRARTERSAVHPDLRGRTYAIPFDRVWRAVCAMVDGGRRGWRMLDADDLKGTVAGELRTFLYPRLSGIRVRVGLDANGQTRVDLDLVARSGLLNVGASRRRVGRFFRDLDAKLDASPGEILASR